MKLESSAEPITNLSFHSFEINNSHVRKLLQDSIYSDKLIFLQELPSNAYDSIVRMYGEKASELGEITVTFNTDEGIITITDNGTGMSKKTFLDVYRIYGNSDKWNTNEEIGCYGIGSKSPLAITDSFIVESWSIEDRKYYKVLVTFEGITFLEELELSDRSHGCTIHIPYQFKETDALENLREKLIKTVRFWNIRTTLIIIKDGQKKCEKLGFQNFDEYAKKAAWKTYTYNTYRQTDDFDDVLLHIDNRVINAYLVPMYRDTHIYLNGIQYKFWAFEADKAAGEVLIKRPQILDITANREKIVDNYKKEKFLKFLGCVIFKALYEQLKEKRITLKTVKEWINPIETYRGTLRKAMTLLNKKTKLFNSYTCTVFSTSSDRTRFYKRETSSILIDLLTEYSDSLYYSEGKPILTKGQKNYIRRTGRKVAVVILDEETLQALKEIKIELKHYSKIPESEKPPEVGLPELEIWRGGIRKLLTKNNLTENKDIALVFVGRDKISKFKNVKLGGYWFVGRKDKKTMRILMENGIRCLTEDEFYEEIAEMELLTNRGPMKAKELAKFDKVRARSFIHRSVLEKMGGDEIVVRIPPFSESVFSKLVRLEKMIEDSRGYYYDERRELLKELPEHFAVLRLLGLYSPVAVHEFFEFIDKVEV